MKHRSITSLCSRLALASWASIAPLYAKYATTEKFRVCQHCTNHPYMANICHVCEYRNTRCMIQEGKRSRMLLLLIVQRAEGGARHMLWFNWSIIVIEYQFVEKHNLSIVHSNGWWYKKYYAPTFSAYEPEGQAVQEVAMASNRLVWVDFGHLVWFLQEFESPSDGVVLSNDFAQCKSSTVVHFEKTSTATAKKCTAGCYQI